MSNSPTAHSETGRNGAILSLTLLVPHFPYYGYPYKRPLTELSKKYRTPVNLLRKRNLFSVSLML